MTGRTASLVQTLSEACRREVVREKIVVAPSLAIGHQITDAVAQSGTSWVNLRIETPRTIADAVTALALASEGLTVLSRAQALALVERACDVALGPDSYFAAVADRPGVHRAIQRTIDDLRHAGVDLRAVPHSAFEDDRKAADLARVLEVYEKELSEGCYVDRYAVTSRAIEALRSGASRPWSADALWFLVEDPELTGAEKELLRLASGDITPLVPPDAVPADLALELRHADGEENELRATFRTLLASDQPFDSAEIAYSSDDPYLPLAVELSLQYDIPCTFARGVPVHFTRPGQACLGFLRWIGEGWHSRILQRMARAGALRFRDREAMLTASAFERLLRIAGIGWGRDRHVEQMESIIADKLSKLEELEDGDRRARMMRSVDDARETLAVLTKMLTLTESVAGPDRITTSSAAGAAAVLVKQFASVSNERDGMAQEAICRLLEELASVGGQSEQDAAPPSEVTRRLADAVRAIHAGASNPRPGFLHVAPIRAAGWNARERLFVVGLDSQRHPGRGLQDPILLDAERSAINDGSALHLPLLGDAPVRADAQFRRLLARSSGRKITLSHASRSIHDRRERFPSSSLLGIVRELEETAGTLDAAKAGDGFIAAQPLAASDWWLRRRFDGAADFRASVLSSHANLAAGAEAELARSSGRLTKFDGYIAGAGEDLDPRRNGRVYSSSALETMASCPYRYFINRVLHVEPLAELEFNPDVWLEAWQFGVLFHEVLQRTMEESGRAAAKPSLAFLPQMLEIAEDSLTRWRRIIPPPGESAFERRRSELAQSCSIFLRNEEDAGLVANPRFFEVSFGFGEDDPGSIAMPDPLVLPLGGGKSIQIRGRIDRVDHDPARNEWHVWDYKSGSTFGYDAGGRLQCGTRLQHAIYARAVDAMLQRKGLKGKVTLSGYYFPTPKGRGRRIDRQCSDGELSAALNHLFDTVGSGYFPHAQADRCRFCEFAAVCGSAELAADRTAARMTNEASDPAVRAWIDLQGVV